MLLPSFRFITAPGTTLKIINADASAFGGPVYGDYKSCCGARVTASSRLYRIKVLWLAIETWSNGAVVKFYGIGS